MSEEARAIRSQANDLAVAIMKRIYADHAARYGDYDATQHDKSIRDIKYHLGYLAEALAASDVSLLLNYCDWVQVLFTNIGLPDDVLEHTLKATKAVLQDELPDSAEATSFVDTALARLVEVESPESFIDPGTELGALAEEYLRALLKGDRQEANRLVMEAVDAGTPVRDIYLQVFQPVQREVGRLWQMNQVSVAQEHFCTAATQLIMSQLYPRIFGAERTDRRLVATCVGGELHEIGVRMVADFFEMAGWDTYYVGANAPQETILEAVESQSPDVLAISATMTFHVSAVEEMIRHVRSAGVIGGTKILVGGYPFNISDTLWRQVGADGYAPDAEGAVAVAEELIKESQ